jgi:hypothetical protein
MLNIVCGVTGSSTPARRVPNTADQSTPLGSQTPMARPGRLCAAMRLGISASQRSASALIVMSKRSAAVFDWSFAPTPVTGPEVSDR